MGIDLRIHITLKDGAEVPAFTLSDDDDPGYYDKWVKCESGDSPIGATHVYDSLHRLYHDEYSRGDWPMISAMLLRLFGDENVTKIWYDGDCGDPCDDREMTLDRLLSTMRYFVEESR